MFGCVTQLFHGIFISTTRDTEIKIRKRECEMLEITKRNFDHVGALMDYELEDGTMLHASEWNGECYTVEEVPYYPIYRGVGEPDEDGDYEEYETIGFERMFRPENQIEGK